MISIREQAYGLNVALYNEFTLEDFNEFEEAALKCAKTIRRPDMLLDLSLLKDFTLDMAVEQLKFMREHEDEFGRIAIVVDDVWIKLAARLSGLITQSHPKYFDEVAEAQAWLLGEAGE
ncbi:STAS/SEC14 domain-containing protein [Uruburuella testudinis]|uniref:STAS/SEC14 domain-containing protein n=1 Tax=Uruburuella testudinis TaxID=1282863 RepID=A0ABY4DXC4_9NEIS|nr:STAS/SEC14 domain-containing protein [Uruburuella testudinis]UOO83257.1 STAS/SEC14 domain-containing protein [Uruburuella testudinis]